MSPGGASTLAEDVRAGLTGAPKSLPPKHFYDDTGSELFDAICDTPEYYPTRTEHALLRDIAPKLWSGVAPTDVVELGSGMARKTRALFDVAATEGRCRYIPFDVSEGALRASGEQLLNEYPWLHIHGVVGDYDRHLVRIPDGKRRLFLFLGGTIGNFDRSSAVAFLSKVRQDMGSGDRLLLGTDLVKDHTVLNAAYNDSAGITAEFNKNVLRVINRELEADFVVEAFNHLAFFNPVQHQIEMHLESTQTHRARIAKLDLDVELGKGERILTEISRKFTQHTVTDMLAAAGLELEDWFTPASGYFGLSLSRPA